MPNRGEMINYSCVQAFFKTFFKNVVRKRHSNITYKSTLFERVWVDLRLKVHQNAIYWSNYMDNLNVLKKVIRNRNKEMKCTRPLIKEERSNRQTNNRVRADSSKNIDHSIPPSSLEQ